MARTKDIKQPWCDWMPERDGDYWDTACGEAFTLTEGTPQENGMRYCPYCGRILKQTRQK